MPSSGPKQKKKPSLLSETMNDLQPQSDALADHASAFVRLPKEEFESLKKKFQRQNQEVIRSNTILIIQLRDAQNQVKRVEAENLKLRTELNAAIQLIDDFEESHNDLHERLKKLYAENVRIRKDTLNNQRKKVQNLTSVTTEIFTSLTQHLQSIAKNLESNVITAWLDLSDELIKDLDLPEDLSSAKQDDCQLNQPQLNIEEAKMKRNEFHSVIIPCERKPSSKDVTRQRPAFKGKLDHIAATVAGQCIMEDEEDVSLDDEDTPAETSRPDLTRLQTAQSLKQDTQYLSSQVQPEMLEVHAARRAKIKPVNYALPSLRTKLRQNPSLESGRRSENLGLPGPGSAKDGQSDKSMISSQIVASQGEKHSLLNLSSSQRIPFSPKSTNIMNMPTSKLSQPKKLDAEAKSNGKVRLRKGGKLGTNNRRDSDG